MMTMLTQIGEVGANGLPYHIPIHPNLVHLTLGLFIVAIAFDIVAALYTLEKPVFKFLAIPVTRAGLHDVGWYNLVAAAIITFFTVAAGFYEIITAHPDPEALSPWGLNAQTTMVWHGIGGVLLLALIVGMTVWRGFQRYVWREDRARQVQWSYLGADFGIHITADRLIRAGIDPNQVVESIPAADVVNQPRVVGDRDFGPS